MKLKLKIMIMLMVIAFLTGCIKEVDYSKEMNELTQMNNRLIEENEQLKLDLEESDKKISKLQHELQWIKKEDFDSLDQLDSIKVDIFKMTWSPDKLNLAFVKGNNENGQMYLWNNEENVHKIIEGVNDLIAEFIWSPQLI
ncbi:hypothetical protein [Chengkuizengella axinellae]|uniref:Lipoprotein n=1 Tax=Chengkuizengella axinellae TaxID=3064388 RepID=A0ABT9IY21_9BACL|nr:hypothetical protein [Chengkuizengella sp. 2205SS18-9]MDP5274271.1 hypothetical protein [Chengkuizengella sp. 2205SS18-9]